MPCTVPFGRPSEPASSTTPSRPGPRASSRSTAAARSIDWIAFDTFGRYGRGPAFDNADPSLLLTYAVRPTFRSHTPGSGGCPGPHVARYEGAAHGYVVGHGLLVGGRRHR